MEIDAYEIHRCVTAWPRAWTAVMKFQSIVDASSVPIRSSGASIRCNAFQRRLCATDTQIVEIEVTKWPIAATTALSLRATTACASPVTKCATAPTIVETAATKCIADRNAGTTNTIARPKDA